MDQKVEKGWTKLHQACVEDNAEKIMSTIVLEQINSEDKNGKPPLAYLNERSEGYKTCLIALLIKMAILYKDKFFISKKNLQIVKESKLMKKILIKCLKEIDQVQHLKFHGSLTYYDLLLTKKIEKLSYPFGSKCIKKYSKFLNKLVFKLKYYLDDLWLIQHKCFPFTLKNNEKKKSLYETENSLSKFVS